MEDSKEDQFARPTLRTNKESTWFCSMGATVDTQQAYETETCKIKIFHPLFD